MSDLRTAAQLALKVLDGFGTHDHHPFRTLCADLRTALAQTAECPHGVDDGACKECYAQPVEPVAYQYRMRPMWGSRGANWGPWEDCSKGKHDDCKKAPVVNDWEHESRALYTAPPDTEALLTQALEALEIVQTDANTTPNAYEAQRQTIAAIKRHKGMT